MSVNTKMTAIANEIRTLSGTTDPMGLDAMATNLNGANVEVGDQSDLLDQAIAALEGKAAGGGASIETCTVTFSKSGFYMECCMATTYDDGFGLVVLFDSTTSASIENVVVGSHIGIVASSSGVLNPDNGMFTYEITGDAEYVYANSNLSKIIVNGDCSVSLNYD